MDPEFDGGGKKSSRRKRSTHPKNRQMAPDDIQQTVNNAMRQVDEAMKNVNLSTAHIPRQGQYKAPAGPKVQPTLYSFNNTNNSYIGTVVHINKASNVQVGSHNKMVVDAQGKARNRFEDTSSDDDSDDDYDADEMHNAGHGNIFTGQSAQPANPQPQQQQQQSENNWMNDDEKKILELTRSTRQLNHEDVNIVCDAVGNWRRFFRILGLEDTYLEQLNLDFNAQGVKVILLEGLKEWMSKEGRDACLGRLASTLQRIGYLDALKKFKL